MHSIYTIFFLLAVSPATSIDHDYVPNMINLAWGGATCIKFYNISVNGILVATTTELSYIYTFDYFGRHNIEIISIDDDLQNAVGVINRTYYWDRKIMMMCILNVVIFRFCFYINA